MNRCERGEAPPILLAHGPDIARRYAERRGQSASYRFSWPRRGGQPLLPPIREALGRMTDEHCSYCDGCPIDAMSDEQVDHFRPKTRPEFYMSVCDWDNLFLCCGACNKAKLDQWDEDLLRPDAADYEFDRYFEYRFETGELHPSTVADEGDRRRAARTIELLALNRAGACTARRQIVRLLCADPVNDPTLSYRYLHALLSG